MHEMIYDPLVPHHPTPLQTHHIQKSHPCNHLKVIFPQKTTYIHHHPEQRPANSDTTSIVQLTLIHHKPNQIIKVS